MVPEGLALNTVFGIVTSGYGIACDEVLAPGGQRPQLRTRAWATPAEEVRREQASTVPVDLEHSGIPVGEVLHLELRNDQLWAVAHVRDEVGPVVPVTVRPGETVLVETELYWSASRLSTPDWQDVVIDSIALTESPASLGARPVRFLPGDVYSRATWNINTAERELLTRAAETKLRRRHNEPIRVHGAVDPDHLPIAPGSYVRRRREGTGLPPGWRWSGGHHGSVLRVS